MEFMNDPFIVQLLRRITEATAETVKSTEDYPGYMPERHPDHVNEIDCEPGLPVKFRRHLRVERRDALRGREIDELRESVAALESDVGEFALQVQRRFREIKETPCDALHAVQMDTAFKAALLDYGFDRFARRASASDAPGGVVGFVEGLRSALSEPQGRAAFNQLLQQLDLNVKLEDSRARVAPAAVAPVTGADPTESKPDADFIRGLVRALREPTTREAFNGMLGDMGLQVVTVTPPPVEPAPPTPRTSGEPAPAPGPAAPPADSYNQPPVRRKRKSS